jgi:hypothetical protein
LTLEKLGKANFVRPSYPPRFAAQRASCTLLQEWRDPRHQEFRQSKTAWRLFNAVTEVLKKGALDRLPRRTTAFHGILDGHCGLLTADPKAGLAAPQDADFVQAV